MKYLWLVVLLVGCANGAPQSGSSGNVAGVSANNLLFFGDSFTQLGPYPSAVGRALGLGVTNLGVGGNVSSQTLEIIRGQNISRGQVSFWLVGYNDERAYGLDVGYLNEYEANLRAGIALLSRDGELYIGNTVRMMSGSYHIGQYRNGSDESVRVHNEILINVVRDMALNGYHVHFVDVSSGYDPYTMSEEDLMHPNELGFDYIANCFLLAYDDVNN